jgi:hypothetical protein
MLMDFLYLNISLVPKALWPVLPIWGVREMLPMNKEILDPVNPIIVTPAPLRPHDTFPALVHPLSIIEEDLPDPELEASGSKKGKGWASSKGRKSRSQSASSRVKSAEFVVDSDDGQQQRLEAKGKGKAQAVDEEDQMDVDDAVVSELESRGRKRSREVEVKDEMDIDPPVLTPGPVTNPTCRMAGTICIKPLAKQTALPTSDDPVTSTAATSSPSRSCESCIRKKKICKFMIGAFACMACRGGKSKCSSVPDGWRNATGHQKEWSGSQQPKKVKTQAVKKTPAEKKNPENKPSSSHATKTVKTPPARNTPENEVSGSLEATTAKTPAPTKIPENEASGSQRPKRVKTPAPKTPAVKNIPDNEASGSQQPKMVKTAPVKTPAVKKTPALKQRSITPALNTRSKTPAPSTAVATPSSPVHSPPAKCTRQQSRSCVWSIARESSSAPTAAPASVVQATTPSAPAPPMTQHLQPTSAKLPPSAVALTSLGQVPSKYIYLVSREGNNVSSGIQLETWPAGEESSMGALESKVEQLEEANVALQVKVSSLENELKDLKTTVAILVAGQNGHSAMLERHRMHLQGIEPGEGQMAVDNNRSEREVVEPLIPEPSSPRHPTHWDLTMLVIGMEPSKTDMAVDDTSESLEPAITPPSIPKLSSPVIPTPSEPSMPVRSTPPLTPPPTHSDPEIMMASSSMNLVKSPDERAYWPNPMLPTTVQVFDQYMNLTEYTSTAGSSPVIHRSHTPLVPSIDEAGASNISDEEEQS